MRFKIYAASPSALMASALTFVTPATSQQSESSTLDQVVVTANRLPESKFAANANISVITRDDIQRMHMTSIDEALRTQPGIQFLNYGMPGYNLSRVRINGTDQVLVLVDGVNVTMLGSGVTFPAHFISDMDNIERIEVLRGSAAVIYGSNAKGGVINIITRKATQENQTRATVSAGSFDTRDHALSNEGSFGDWSYRVNLKRFEQGTTKDANGVRWVGDQEYEKGGAMLSRKIGEGSDVTFTFNTDFNEYSLLDHIYNQAVDGEAKTRDVTLAFNSRISDSLRNTLTLRESHFLNHGILHSEFGDGDFWNDRYKSLAVANQLSWTLGDRNLLIGGAEYLKTSSKVADFTGSRLGISSVSVYLQDEFSPGAGWKLTGGLRLDKPNSVRANLGSNTSASLKVGYTFGSSDSVYVAANDYFVLPSGYQLFSDFGNPHLLPEEGRNFEIGYSHRFGSRAELSAHAFRRESTQNIGFDNSELTYVNGEEKARGFDVQLDAVIGDAWSASMAWSHLKYENEGGTTAFGYLPKNLLNIGLAWKRGSWDIGVDARAFLGRDGNDVRSEAWPSDHYWVTNLGVNYVASKHLQVFLKANNLFDTLYAEHTNVIWAEYGGASDWYGMPGRNAVAGVTLSF